MNGILATPVYNQSNNSLLCINFILNVFVLASKLDKYNYNIFTIYIIIFQ